MTREEKHQRNLRIVELRKQGYSYSELEALFGLSNIDAICKKYGVAGVMSSREGKRSNQYQKQTLSAQKQYVESFLPGQFSYCCGYKDCDSMVTIKHNACGNTFEKSMVSIRHHRPVNCPFCEKAQIEAQHQVTRRYVALIRKKQRATKKEERFWRSSFEQIGFVTCPVCGCEFLGRTYCSEKCLKKATNNIHESRRRAKIKGVYDDADIELHALFRRDGGVCWLCGEECDWEDKTTVNGTVICGDRYPSIDHVVPLAKGGRHSWANVKLAHRYCNAVKRDNLTSPPSE